MENKKRFISDDNINSPKEMKSVSAYFNFSINFVFLCLLGLKVVH